jgi:hypothetical protein
MAVWRGVELGGAPVHHHRLAQRRVARQPRTAAPCATWQYQQRLIDETTTAIISRSSFDSPESASITSL